ncbi:MAG: hypothetical protein NVS1B14_02070 [Vulcanimicrobiaceae bacterium]
MLRLLKRPSAFLPIAMSAFVLVLIALRIARFGTLHQADEGTEAHLFQVLMPLQGAITAFFALTWLPRSPKAAAQVLALQIFAAILVFAAGFSGHGERDSLPLA